MATDGCQPPAWTGAAFSYLPARHRAEPHAPTHPATTPAAPAPAPRGARTGTWDGPAPKLPGAAARAAAAARVVPPPPLPAVRLPGGRALPHAALAVGPDTTADVLTAALRGGVTAIDVSAGVGAAAADALRALPPADRAALVVTLALPAGATAADPVPALAAALNAAGLGDRAADVVLLPGPPPPRTAAATWAAAAPALLACGRAAAVGVADWGLADVEAALEAAAAAPEVPRPALLRVELHPRLPQRKLLGVCRRKGVPVVAGGALGGGALLRDESVVAAAATAGKTPAELLLRWAAERGTPALVAATTPAHAAAAAAAAQGWTLPPAVRAALDAFETGAHFHRPGADWPDAEVGGALKPSLVL